MSPSLLSSKVIRRNSALMNLIFSMWALDLRPCFMCASTTRCLPSGVRGPVLRPPCNRHLAFPLRAAFWQGVPRRVLARQRWPGHWGPSCVSRPASMNFWRLTKVNILNAPCMGLCVKSLYRGSFQGLTWFNCGPWSAGSTPCLDTLVPLERRAPRRWLK